MTDVLVNDSFSADTEVDCLIIGGGAAGLTAALAASQDGAVVLVAERETRLAGSTALSSGLIPAAETNAQKRQNISDTKNTFYADIMEKNGNSADPNHVNLCVENITLALDWLEAKHGIPFHVLDDFLYPSHTNFRMHAVPEVTGEELINYLERAVSDLDIYVSCNLKIVNLVKSNNGKILGAIGERPDGSTEAISSKTTILACNGYGGNSELISENIPEMQNAIYFGHAGNQGEAVIWGRQLDAKIDHLSGYQGHGSVAHPHGILVTWALMMEGGIQVNTNGKRFSNEHKGYSEQAVNVLSQPEKIAFNIFDERLCALGRKFEDFRKAEKANAIISADTIEDLAKKLSINKKLMKGCKIFLYKVKNPQDYGTVEIKKNKISTIKEKPKKSKSSLIITAVLLITNPLPKIKYPISKIKDEQFMLCAQQSLKCNMNYLDLFQRVIINS